jgi:hypothetical protein
MTMALEMLGEFNKSNPEVPRDTNLSDERVYIFFLGLSMLRFCNSILDPGEIFLFVIDK